MNLAPYYTGGDEQMTVMQQKTLTKGKDEQLL